MDFSYETASLGLSGYFQNTLGTFSGMVGYAIHPDPNTPAHWRSALHLKMVYTGLYPVFEAQMDLGDENATLYLPSAYNYGPVTTYQLRALEQERPLLSASARVYVPLQFAKGGIHYGVTPQLRYSVSNNVYVKTPLSYFVPEHFQGLPYLNSPAAPIESLSGPVMQHVSASVRGYVMASRAQSQTYPRWGIGLEGGIGFRPGLSRYYAPNLYGYAYGYLPGITRAQGLKWTFMGQKKLGRSDIGDVYANVVPRGYGSRASALVGQNFASQWRVTLDYGIPIYVGDISIPAVAYIKNFLLTPHADYMGVPGGHNLWSAGADISASLARLLFLPFDASIGVSVSYLGGSLYPHTGQGKPWDVSLIFGVDF